MKSMAIIFTIIASGCTSLNKTNRHSLNFETLRDFEVATTTEQEVKKVLGEPNETIESNLHLTLRYNDPQSDSQRASISFNKSTRRLANILWIPKEGDFEYSLTAAKESFTTAKFNRIIEQNNNPHIVSSSAILFVDEKSGVTIRYDEKQNAVEAIAIYSSNSRKPADQFLNKESAFTFGDEPSLTK